MTIHQNLIAGEWIGSEATRNINPSDTNDTVGLYASASAQDAANAIAAAKGSSYGPREQGKYAAEFYTTVKTAYTLA
ncbi:hypothetical protein BS627_03010 [Agrobacterium salinitolerans]|nr:hypothetical protein BS627_03010 [Agrobacterium salinitolerans]PNQ25605.1 hypothetical protein C2E26_03070 [Rhizobium sp. YIC5082]